MDPLAKRVVARSQAQAADEINVHRLERLIESVEKEAKQMRSSLDLYKRDPGKYRPQIDNLVQSATSIQSAMRVILRSVPEK